MQPLASIPSPAEGVWHLGPVPIRAYALMIILGIVVAVWLGERRWAAKGGTPGVIIDVAVWAVPFGLVGGRLYHVVTDYQRYFGEGRDPVNALKIWEGGLGIWGAVVLGALGAVIGCRRHGVSVLALGDAIAPGIALAQAIGRWGNWWNQELYGRPLDAPWALEIDQAHRPRLSDGSLDPKYADIATYHPTFLYESLWCVGVAILVIWADRRWKLTHGRAFALYVAAYTVGRFWIEWLRIDDAHQILGLRLNDWTAVVVFLGAVAYLYYARNKTGPENVGAPAETGTAAEAETAPEPEPAEKAEKADKADKPEKAAPVVLAKDDDAEPEAKPEQDAEPETVLATPEPEAEAKDETRTEAAPEVKEGPETRVEAEPVDEPEAPADEPADKADDVEADEPEAGPEPDIKAEEKPAAADAEGATGNESGDKTEDKAAK
ncbi:prolipoprotein diacylglyceryl transferase [Spirillospora sp. NPDC050679]